MGSPSRHSNPPLYDVVSIQNIKIMAHWILTDHGWILPVDSKKRISGNLDEIASRLNASDASGPRLLPVPGEIFTEIEAISTLSGVTAELVASGGVYGAEDSIWLAISGGTAKESSAKEIIAPLLNEPSFELI